MEKDIIFVSKDTVSIATDKMQLRNLRANALRLGEDELAKACLSRLIQLSGEGQDTALARRVYEAIGAYEEMLYQSEGRVLRASHERRNLANKGAHQALIEWIKSRHKSAGFDMLLAKGLEHYTMEAIIEDFPDDFDEAIMKAAQKKLYG